MEKLPELTRDRLLFGVLFGVGLLLRLLLLDAHPLREVEAEWAYQAWELWQGQRSDVGQRAGYLALTRALFSLLGDSRWVARLVPAAAGSLLVWFPYLIRDRVGRFAALVMALGIAFDPGLVAASRAVSSPIFPAATLFLALVLLHGRQYGWAAVSTAFFFLSGAWGMGVLILAGSLALAHILDHAILEDLASEQRAEDIPWRKGSLIGAGILLVVGSSFLSAYEGISAWFGAVPAFIRGWTEASSVPVGRLLVVLLAYQPLALIFGITGAVQGWRRKDSTDRFMVIWFLFGLFLLLVYPGRQVWDLVWILLPLWWLTARAIHRFLLPFKSQPMIWILAGLIFILSCLMWLSFSSLTVQQGNPKAELLQWGMIAATFVLGIISTSIVTAEKSWSTARRGLVVGVLGSLSIFMVSGMVSAAYRIPAASSHLWLPDPGISQRSLLRDTLQEASVYHTGREDAIAIEVQSEHASLRWALRNFSQVRYVSDLNAPDNPPVLITGGEPSDPTMMSGYVGQDFVLHTRVGWAGTLPDDWKTWLASREGPEDGESILVWVRRDAHPGGDVLLDGGEEGQKTDDQG